MLVCYFIIAPITSVNYRVYWNTFGFVASTSSFCRTTTPLTSTYCLLTSSIYLNNAFYCNKQRDTIHIDCAPSSTSKFLISILSLKKYINVKMLFQLHKSIVYM